MLTDTSQSSNAGRKPPSTETLRDGTRVLIRYIGSEDADLERRLLQELSPESKQFRFLGQVKVTDELVRRLTNVDPRDTVALIALVQGATGDREIGVGRFCLDEDRATCECAITVSDEWQGKGLGYLMMRDLIELARARGVRRMYSIDAADNHKMRELAQAFGFERVVHPDFPSEVVHSLVL